MTITNLSTTANTIGLPQFVEKGSLVTVQPRPGAIAALEYTLSDSVGIRNNTAVWQAWQKGPVTQATSDLLNESVYVRLTSAIADSTLQVEPTPTPQQLAAFLFPWGAPTTQGLTGAVASIPTLYGSAICGAGDSIMQQNSTVIGISNNFNQRGPIAQALSYLGHPWDMQPSDNFAVFGSTMDAIIAIQLPAILAAHVTRKYTRCFISSFTNDTNSGVSTIAQIKAAGLTFFNALRAVGIIPVHTGVRPRGADAAVTPAKQQNMQINEWLYQLGQAGIIEYIDVTAGYADNSTAFGNVLASTVYDFATSKLHPNGTGAILEGRTIAAWYTARGIAPQLKFATQQNDFFDRVNNPSGVCFNNANPLLQGGTTAPTGMTTVGGTWSKVNRALPNGQNRTDATCALAASTLHYLYDDATTTGDWSATQLQTGDIIEGRAKVVITGGVNITSAQLALSVNDGTTSNLNYALFTDASPLPDGDHVLYLKTPRVTIQRYSGSGNCSMFMRAECQTGATGAGTYTVQGFEVRKVN